MRKIETSVIAIIILCTLLLSIAVAIITPRSKDRLPAHVRVDDYIGINLDTNQVYFGTVQPGGHGNRGVIFKSEHDASLLLAVHGQAASWISTENKWYPIASKKKTVIPFLVQIPSNTTFGNYTATIDFFTYSPFARFLLP